jgi:hypothetical protein
MKEESSMEHEAYSCGPPPPLSEHTIGNCILYVNANGRICMGFILAIYTCWRTDHRDTRPRFSIHCLVRPIYRRATYDLVLPAHIIQLRRDPLS